ncbi:hypothetical protein K466DRAFT_31011 [Polyporus arcularius HHB13444]|uniref:Uncharacterized protein n=1 Tax=Polyporus arcularius HHB13444 TaxID=1314778 RepID=A0A5C3NNI9_9APHY|nr:hypothetical protein K466DRAFT_31011 [Polyporus arcularius HHB13444]
MTLPVGCETRFPKSPHRGPRSRGSRSDARVMLRGWVRSPLEVEPSRRSESDRDQYDVARRGGGAPSLSSLVHCRPAGCRPRAVCSALVCCALVALGLALHTRTRAFQASVVQSRLYNIQGCSCSCVGTQEREMRWACKGPVTRCVFLTSAHARACPSVGYPLVLPSPAARLQHASRHIALQTALSAAHMSLSTSTYNVFSPPFCKFEMRVPLSTLTGDR